MMKPSASAWLDQLSTATGTADLRHTMASHHPAIATIPERIAIVGAADEGQRLADVCDRCGIEVVAIVDDSSKKHGAAIAKRMVQSNTALDNVDRAVPVIIASHITLNAAQRLRERGFQHVSPFAALQLLHPDTFSPHMFHSGWFEDLYENRARYAAFAHRLADAPSRAVLDAVLGYRQTLVPDVLAAVTRPYEVYMARDLFALARDEIYVDAGAYDGDTIRRFIERTGGKFSRAYGFEPDPATFARLQTNFAGEPRVTSINAGLWSSTETLRFHNDAGRASILGSEGEVEVKVIALDDALDGQPVTFIKMNIEGAELHALRGASSTIRRDAPKLAIAAYHRPSDLWEVAQVVDDLSPGYDLFLRQHRGGLVETVLYARPS